MRHGPHNVLSGPISPEARHEDGTAAPTSSRFAALAGPAWVELPRGIRRRFSRAHLDGDRVIYLGEIAFTRVTPIGWLFAALARLIGAPLPLASSGRVPITVVVTECERVGGQLWTRICSRERGFPQVIQSAKRFAGPTGLEEVVGGGVFMRLRLGVEGQALVFRSEGYFAGLRDRAWRIPSWLTPGLIEVVHREAGGGRFSFGLKVVHPLAGVIIQQLAYFQEREEP